MCIIRERHLNRPFKEILRRGWPKERKLEKCYGTMWILYFPVLLCYEKILAHLVINMRKRDQ
jgi:hypothetical protein